MGCQKTGWQTDCKDAAGKWIEALKGAAGLAGLELNNTLDVTMDEISLLQYYVRNRFPEKPPNENTTAGIVLTSNPYQDQHYARMMTYRTQGAETSSHLFFSCCMVRQVVRLITAGESSYFGVSNLTEGIPFFLYHDEHLSFVHGFSFNSSTNTCLLICAKLVDAILLNASTFLLLLLGTCFIENAQKALDSAFTFSKYLTMSVSFAM
ncbi:hypothetical protein Tco_1353440 [Tanacetum coccineum]